MSFKVLHGGRMRQSFGVPGTYVAKETWEQGDFLTLCSDGIVRTADNDDKGVVGPACEYRRTVTDSSVIGQDQTYGGYASMILDPAVIVTDRINSGVSIAIGDRLYIGSTGKLSKTATSLVVGVALGDNTSGEVMYLFTPIYIA